MIGRTLGQYEIVEKIGAGGMGEVYRALDTRLDRSVAVKVLPDLFAADAERLARFEREARLLASLNHPHIATLYGIEHVDGVHFLAMELVEGEDIAHRIARGPMPVGEAVKVASQIAEALEAAHEHGVIHRDLKPSNVRFGADGNVKVLDFGLAKAMEGDASDADLSKSPTITSAGTSAGVILGTAAYMSPEQARGRPVDKRTDIWAFGCVLYEMLTGRQLFAGETVSDTIARILERAPDWDALPAGASRRLKRLLERCLDKDPRRRLRDIGEARVQLEDALADSRITPVAGARAARGVRRPWIYAAAGLVIGAAAMFALLESSGGEVSREVTRLSVKPPENVTPLAMTPPALSRNGRLIAFIAFRDTGRRLYLRDLAGYETRMLADVDATNPFFSPDGRWVGFQSQDESGARLMRVSVDGGTPLPICEVGVGPSAGCWAGDGHVIVEAGLRDGLGIVPAAGGKLVSLTRPDTTEGEFGHWSPCVLPGDDIVLFTSWRTRLDDGRIKAVRRSTGETWVVVENGVTPHFMEPGFLLYTLGATLMCAPFDAENARVIGDPVPVLDPVQVRLTDGATSVAVAGGSLCYLPPEDYDARLVWADAEGNVEPVVPERRDYDAFSVSPDGRRIAVDIEQGGKSDIWVMDLERRAMTRLTVDGTNEMPVFNPDGRTVTFGSMRAGPFELYSIDAGGGSSPHRLFSSDSDIEAGAWTPDGTALLFHEFNPGFRGDIMRYTPGDGAVTPFIQTAFSESGADVSPDGRRVAYHVFISDRAEVFVSPMEGGNRVQVTADGGNDPRWSHDGRALFVRSPARDAIYRIDVVTEPEFRAGTPERILSDGQLGGYIEHYDTHPDGRLVVVVNRDVRGERVYLLVLNFDMELERLMR